MPTLDPQLRASTIPVHLRHGVPEVDVMRHNVGTAMSARVGDVCIYGSPEDLRQLATDLAAAIDAVVGFGPPTTVLASDLADHIGDEFRVSEYSLSDGKDVWSEWRTIDGLNGSPFGTRIGIRTWSHGPQGRKADYFEFDNADAVQVRRRLPLAEVGEAKAVA